MQWLLGTVKGEAGELTAAEFRAERVGRAAPSIAGQLGSRFGRGLHFLIARLQLGNISAPSRSGEMPQTSPFATCNSACGFHFPLQLAWLYSAPAAGNAPPVGPMASGLAVRDARLRVTGLCRLLATRPWNVSNLM